MSYKRIEKIWLRSEIDLKNQVARLESLRIEESSILRAEIEDLRERLAQGPCFDVFASYLVSRDASDAEVVMMGQAARIHALEERLDSFFISRRDV